MAKQSQDKIPTQCVPRFDNNIKNRPLSLAIAPSSMFPSISEMVLFHTIWSGRRWSGSATFSRLGCLFEFVVFHNIDKPSVAVRHIHIYSKVLRISRNTHIHCICFKCDRISAPLVVRSSTDPMGQKQSSSCDRLVGHNKDFFSIRLLAESFSALCKSPPFVLLSAFA